MGVPRLGPLEPVAATALGVARPSGLPCVDDARAAVAAKVALGVRRPRPVHPRVGVAGVDAAAR